MQLNQLKPNPHNPRQISDHQYRALQESITRFGDLSGIVYNQTTDQLVGGHMRTRGLQSLSATDITITEQLDAPNSVGTIGRGYVLLGDEKFPVRIVQWSLDFEMAANIAANKIAGEFDDQMLAEIFNQMDNELKELTGFTDKEIDALNAAPVIDDNDQSEYETFNLKVMPEDAAIISRAISMMKQRLGTTSNYKAEADGQAVAAIAEGWLQSIDVDQGENNGQPSFG